MAGQQKKDLVVLVPCQDIEVSIDNLLSRHKALEIRELKRTRDYDVYRHLGKDPGCLLESHDFLRPFSNQYTRALVLFDRQGCGKDNFSREHLETEVEERLAANGWNDRAAAVVIDPELEAWVWNDSPHVSAVLGWQEGQADLCSWLIGQGFMNEGEAKPHHPKEAVEQVLRLVRKPRSAALYGQLAERVTLQKCVDPAFSKFKLLLQGWFSQEEG